MSLSTANGLALSLLLGVAVFWVVNFCMRLAGQRLYWVTFWTLVFALPALAIYWFSTPWHMERGANFGAGMPREYALGVLALVLWLAALALELIVFIALKVRDVRRSQRASDQTLQDVDP